MSITIESMYNNTVIETNKIPHLKEVVISKLTRTYIYTFSRVFLSFLESFFSFFPNNLLNTLQNIIIYIDKEYIRFESWYICNKKQSIIDNIIEDLDKKKLQIKRKKLY
jgi:hypothetical protein